MLKIHCQEKRETRLFSWSDKLRKDDQFDLFSIEQSEVDDQWISI